MAFMPSRCSARLAASAVVALALTAATAPARADGHYFTFGAGPDTVSDELGAVTGNGGHVRMAIGHRFGNVAVEGYLAPQFLDERINVSGLSYGVDVRYIVPLTSGVQGYVRGDLSRMTLHDDAWDGDGRGLAGAATRSGRGLGGGVGIQLRGKVRALGFLYWPFFFLPLGPKVDAALFVDHGVDFYRLHDSDGRTDALDAKFTRVTIGFNVGKDF